MLLLTAVFAVVCGYLSHRRAERKAEEYEMLRERTAYEAYLTLCESVAAIEKGEGEAYARIGADAAARLCLFSDAGAMSLAAYVSRLGGVPEEAARLAEMLQAEREDWRKAVAEAEALAERSMKPRVKSEDTSEGWRLLRERTEVGRREARDVACAFIGGGAVLTDAENHTFPLLYSFGCKNAAAEVTRMGGRLYRMWIFRIGEGKECSLSLCRQNAESFLKRAGIGGAEISEETVAEDSVRYVFTADGGSVTVTVKRRGGRVCFFDASHYYRYG